MCVCVTRSPLSAARGAVCVCGDQDDREHHDCDDAAAVHVRLYRGSAVQGLDQLTSDQFSVLVKAAGNLTYSQMSKFGRPWSHVLSIF